MFAVIMSLDSPRNLSSRASFSGRGPWGQYGGRRSRQPSAGGNPQPATWPGHVLGHTEGGQLSWPQEGPRCSPGCGLEVPSANSSVPAAFLSLLPRGFTTDEGTAVGRQRETDSSGRI